MTKNVTDQDKHDYEKDRAKQENKDNTFKQRVEDKAAKANPAGGEVEVPIKTVPSNPDLEDPNRIENDPRKNPNLNK